MASKHKLYESLRLLKAAEEALEKLERALRHESWDNLDWNYDTAAVPEAKNRMAMLRQSLAPSALAVAEDAALQTEATS